ncbi:MAG: class II fructose-bisphosphate aldolase [Gammaproteobacteria bacterium]|nr:class II fructose-bisphosphate aldolase [Gammaproteobacteria bacterium]
MSLSTLKDVLDPALRNGYAVAGLVVLGWEDAVAFVQAAEAADCPVILQAGPGCREHTPLPILATMFRHLAENASVPVVAHLDHGRDVEVCLQAMDVGFSSVMYDGSMLPLADNIANTRRVVEAAAKYGVSVEGELGYVGYPDAPDNRPTVPAEAKQYVEATGLDALAISVGNCHLQTEANTHLDMTLLAEIEALTDVPLVIHGGSGLPATHRRELALHSKVCKFNIGTELRQCFGASLRRTLAQDTAVFDRNTILRSVIEPMQKQSMQIMQNLR